MSDVIDIDNESELGTWVPEWAPMALITAARILLALSTAFLVAVVLLAEISIQQMLPWWALLVVYSAHLGALVRFGKDAKKGAEYIRHRWASYVRWANSLT